MKDIYKILDELAIPYTRHDHPAVFTCEEADKYDLQIPGGHTKNLFLRNRKGDKHFLVIIPSTKMVDLKKLEGQISEKKIAFASPERMLLILGVTPGSVTPFGLINDEEKNTVVIVDKALWENEILNFHPNVNTATLGVKREDFKRFLEWCGNKVISLEL